MSQLKQVCNTAAAAAAPCQMSHLDGDDWFLRPAQRETALAAAEAAAAKASSSSSSSISSALSAALLPFVDEERRQSLAALDADTLWFLAELEASGYSGDVLLKWSLHPGVGPKLTTGRWLDGLSLPQQLRELYEQAAVPGFMATLDFDGRL